jgi:hypothetical protein
MAINTSWTVKIGTVASPTDFSSRVMGMQIDQNVDVNVMGRGVARITLLNKDGALTPGGGGTYTSTDWFAQGVFIACLTNTGGADTIHQVFHGVVTDFDLVDDGVYSTVTITALDGFTIGGRTQNVTVVSTGTATYSSVARANLGNALYSGFQIIFPRLGASATDIGFTLLGPDNNITDANGTYSSAADLWQTAVIPGGNDVLYPTTITYQAIAPTTTNYNVNSIPFTNTRNVADRTDFEFDPPGSLSGSKLPFDVDQFQQAFNNETLVTNAEVKGQYAGASTVTVVGGTQNTYGNRSQTFSNTWVADATAANRLANLLVNRYSNSRFSPVSLQTSASLVKRLASDSAVGKWRHLLDIEKGLWQRLKVTWTGSGASSQTAYCVIKGRRISVTPADTVVTLNLGNWADNHGFILDTDQLNVDRLG